MKRFRMTHRFLKTEAEEFDETNAPDWLTSCNTVVGSASDDRWFWRDHVLQLPVGGVVNTWFQKIERIK